MDNFKINACSRLILELRESEPYSVSSPSLRASVSISESSAKKLGSKHSHPLHLLNYQNQYQNY